MSNDKRKAVAKRIADEFSGDHGWDDAAHEDELHKWLLVEKNYRSGLYWLSNHEIRYDASEYHVNQEYAHEWEAQCLVDLDTGVEWDTYLSSKLVYELTDTVWGEE